MLDKDHFPYYHESDRIEQDEMTDLWENINSTTLRSVGDLSDHDSCPRCGWDRCHVTYNHAAGSGKVTCKNNDCSFEVTLQ